MPGLKEINRIFSDQPKMCMREKKLHLLSIHLNVTCQLRITFARARYIYMDRLDPICFPKLDALPGLPHLLYFLLNCPSPCDLGATPLAFPFWRPMHSSFCNGSFLAGDMANPPPASPHQDGSHWFGSTLGLLPKKSLISP